MRLFSINKNQSIVIITLLAVASLGAIYVFYYLPYKEKIIQERRFRTLQNIDRNIHAKIENSTALLGNLLESYNKPSEKRRREDYIANSIKNFTLSIDSIPLAAWRKVDSLKDYYNIEIDKKTERINLRLYKEFVNGSDTFGRRGTIQFSFDQFISSLLQKNVFDQYVIFSNNKPVYETFPAGIEEIKRDSLLGGSRTGLYGSGMKEFNISGKDYKLFLQPVRISSNEALTIGGLLSIKRYQQERNQLPPRLLILLLIIVFGAILLFPWIRLFYMGNKDRLTVMDGILSVIIAMLLMSLLFLAFFTYNISFRVNKNSNVDSKKVLAQNIAASFTREIDTMYHKIVNYDSLLNKNQQLNRDIVFLDSLPRFYHDTDVPVSLADTLKTITKNSLIKHLFWLDKNGNEIRNWNTDSFIAPHGNFSKRAYFRKIMEGDPYYLTGYPPVSFNTSRKFYLDQVISWTNAGFTTVLAIPAADSNGIAAISFKSKSVEDVLLPSGYMFAMIDGNGQVLYHSEPARNLNENLKDEFSGEGRRMLISSLQSHTESVFTAEYFSREYNVAIKPLPYLPYYIVVLGDTSHRETRDMEIFSFSFTMLLLFFLLLALELFTIFFVSAKRSFFKRQLFNTGWVGPRMSCTKEYLLSTLMNCIVILLLILFFHISSFLVYLFILLFSATVTSLFLIFLFAKRYKREEKSAYKYKVDAIRSVIIITLLINLVACLLLKPSPDQLGLFIFYELMVVLLGFGIFQSSEIILNRIQKFKESKPAMIWTKLLFPVFWRWDHINSFSLAALSRLIITSGIPVVFFYVASYNYEQNLGIRYKQAQYADRLLDRLNGNYSASGNLIDSNGIYADSSWISDVKIVDKTGVPSVSYSRQEKRTLDVLGNFRLYITNEATAGKNFYKKGSDDSIFRYNHLLQDACQLGNGSITYMQTQVPGKYLKITSRDLNYNSPPLFKRILFWIFLALCLIVFYFILYYVIRKLFALKTPDLSLWKGMDEKLLSDNKLNSLVFVIGLPGAEKKTKILDKIEGEEILSKDNRKLVYKEGKQWPDTDVAIVDLIRIPETGNKDEEEAWKKYTEEVFNGGYKFIIVNHFEYNIQDTRTNQVKLNFLEGLMQRNTGKIMILSTIHPVAFLDSMFSQPLKEKAKSEAAADKSVPGQDLERWHVLLGHYRIVLLPIEPIPYRDKTITLPQHSSILRMNRQKDDTMIAYQWLKLPGSAIPPANIIDPNASETIVENLSEGEHNFELLITYNDRRIEKEETTIVVNPSDTTDHDFPFLRSVRNETMQTHFLNKMKLITERSTYEVMSRLKDLNQELHADEMVFKLQVTSHYFYMYIWQSLTKEEKFLLYDLAEDDLVNSFDDYNLSMLVAKGVIIRQDGTLRIFNKGFRNFILTAIGNTEAMKIKDQISDKGNWGKLKAPLMIVVFAILLFIMASQEQTYSKLFTYIGALGTAIAAILNLLSKVKGSSNSGG